MTEEDIWFDDAIRVASAATDAEPEDRDLRDGDAEFASLAANLND
jgi:hypothetical protein